MSETLGIAPKRDVILQMTRIGLQDADRNWWIVTVEPHIVRSDFMNPAFWANAAYQFAQFDRIEIRQDDGKFWAEYLVLQADKNSAYLRELNWVDLTKDSVPIKNVDYQYKWRGPYAKHSIVRKKDGSVMVEKLPTKVAAEKWLTEYLERI